MSIEWSDRQFPEVQKLALWGSSSDCSVFLLLRIKDADKARSFLADQLLQDLLAFGDRPKDNRHPAVSIGFTFHGLTVLRLPDFYLDELRKKAPAFCEGAVSRAAGRLGDAGRSAAEGWDEPFRSDPDVLIAIHTDDRSAVDGTARRLQKIPGADGLEGWESGALKAEHLTKHPDLRKIHFGFVDGIAQPKIEPDSDLPAAPPAPAVHGLHRAGELVLGYGNDEQFNRWDDSLTPEEVAGFFRNGSFAVLRKIEQDVEGFETFVNKKAAELSGNYSYFTPEYVKAKLCGRWPNGARVRPAIAAPPTPPTDDDLDPRFDFLKDPDGVGCPFGAHIRRVNPRSDFITPFRLRPLFRRGMPYGPWYSEQTKKQERGLMGLFFCASIEDQFETVLSEWVEKKPLGPPNRGDAKDPLVGHNDDPEPAFSIPLNGGGEIPVKGFQPFVTTRGTAYALFPSRSALRQIARTRPKKPHAAASTDATSGTRASSVRRKPAESRRDQDASLDTAPADRFCDIVMEGGVTSGIIYASAVAELAKHYRFESIGGSSIGAFAAALTAAAEYNRRRSSLDGFQLMEDLPSKLAAEDEELRPQLQRLFRPQPKTRRLFEIFLAALGNKSVPSRIFSGLTAALRQYWPFVAIVVVATALLLAGPFALIWRDSSALSADFYLRCLERGSWVLALLLVLFVAGLLALLLDVVLDIRFGLVPNGFGLCRGWSKDAPYDPPDLSLFLHESIQAAAGRHPIDDPPLTFRDLWNAPGAASDALGCVAGADSQRSINLQVYSTNLAHGRPYRFPLDPADDMGRLFFRPEELEPYFPRPILNYLVGSAIPYRPLPGSRFDPPASAVPDGYLELPREDLPIVVAARLAMSFPLLISAVPLYAIDYERTRRDRGLSRCWMSDGGLCSNFPIHLFDSFVPMWPTFGIALLERNPYRRNEKVWLPEKHYEGGADSWDRFADSKGLGLLTGFLVSLWKAAWRWNDTTMMRMPGVRDRVVRVLLEPGEGGVNINMPGKAILSMSEKYGKPAAEAFRRKFADYGSPGWPEHRWVRFNRLLIALRDQIAGFACAADLDRYTQRLDEQIRDSRWEAPLRGCEHGPPLPSEWPLCYAQANELWELLDALKMLELRFRWVGDNEPYIAVPRPSLRVRHPT